MKSFILTLLTMTVILIQSTTASGASLKNVSAYNTAKQYDGYNERRNRKQLKNILGADPRKTPWCGLFVSFALRKAGKVIPSSVGGTAASWKRYGKGVKLKSAQRGDIVVLRFKRGYHVGLLHSVSGGIAKVLGGNQSNSVQLSSYDVGSIVAIRR